MAGQGDEKTGNGKRDGRGSELRPSTGRAQQRESMSRPTLVAQKAPRAVGAREFFLSAPSGKFPTCSADDLTGGQRCKLTGRQQRL